jgi:lysophospholipase L1-like esterase
MYIDPTARREVARYFAFVVCVLAVFFASPSSAQIVALGASNVQGYGVSASDSFPAQLEAMLRAKRKPYSVANAGISGDTSVVTLTLVSPERLFREFRWRILSR